MSAILTMATFDAFYRAYHTAIERHVQRLVRDRELAADLAQDTFAKVFAAVRTGVTVTAPVPWLYRIATNVAIDELRRRRVILWLPFSDLARNASDEDGVDFPDTGSAARFAESIVERDAIAAVLAHLTSAERLCLALEQQYAPPECARRLGISLNAYKMRLSRARSRFATRWRQEQALAA